MSQPAGHPLAMPQGRRATGGSPFFGPRVAPPAERAYVAQPWSRIPLETLPTVLPFQRRLGVTADDIAVVLSKVTVWPTGLTFQLRMTPRPGDPDATAAVTSPEFYGAAGAYGWARLAKRFRLGVAWDDGRTVTNLGIHHDPEATTPPPALMRIESGHGGPDGTTTEHWVWPIPETGDLTIVTAWVARGLPEQRTVLNGEALRAAAAASRAAEIWPGAQLPPPTPFTDSGL